MLLVPYILNICVTDFGFQAMYEKIVAEVPTLLAYNLELGLHLPKCCTVFAKLVIDFESLHIWQHKGMVD